MRKLLNRLLGTTSTIADEIPEFRYHVSDKFVNASSNHITGVIQLDGITFESRKDSLLESDLDALNLAYAETAKENAGNLSFYTYFLRRKTEVNTVFKFTNEFCQDFADKYVQRFNEKDYYSNRYYIAITLKYEESLDEAIRDLNSVIARFNATLSQYSPRVLTAYKNDNGVYVSEVYDFFYEIINGEKPVVSVPLTGTTMQDILPQSSLHFGYEVLQIKGLKSQKFATMWDLKDFPQTSSVGMFDNAMLSLPFEYNLVSSFKSLSPAKALAMIEKQINIMRSVEDKAVHQQDEMLEAQGYIQSGELAFGAFHCAMVVFGKTTDSAIEHGIQAVASFSNQAGAVFTRSTASAAATYFSQLPLWKDIPRPMAKSSRNLACAFGMHTFSCGKAKGNPIGDGLAIMPLETKAKTLYDFNFHFTNPLEDNLGDSIAGHTLILGATGTGKTTLQTALVSFVQRFDPAMFVLDKDRGMDIFIRALNGDYFDIQEGKPTGINPFQFKDSPRLREFLNELVISCATDHNHACTSEEQNQIKNAIDAVMKLPLEYRRISSILQSIPDKGGNCLYQRLSKWCITEQNYGRFAWCLDNPVNIFDPDDFKIVGFEVGSILKENYQPTEPLLACLLYMKEQMVQRYELICTVVEEFWLALKYKTPESMILDVLKTGRKRGEFMLLVTQSPEEAVQSPIFPAIVQQTPTKLLLPNPDAKYDGGYERIGLTEKEFEKLKALPLESRTFLIKQGHNSSFGILNLYGFNNEINVLSSTKGNVQILDYIYEHFYSELDYVPQSKYWLPVFYEAVQLRKQEKLSIDTIKELVHIKITDMRQNHQIISHAQDESVLTA